jgi:cytochrome c oxidase assembly factor CtaG
MSVVALVVELGVCGAIVWAFVRGCRRRPRVVAWRALALGAGLVALVVALSPWVDAAADRSFAAHMVQHLVLIVIAAPLLVVADAGASIVAGLPGALRHHVAWWHREARVAGLGSVGPWPRFAVHLGAVFAWHAPPLFDAAIENPSLHAFEHLIFLVTAMWFWEPLLTRRGVRRVGEAVGIAYVTAAGVAWSGLGALLTFSSQPWYPAYAAVEGHAAAVHDQQLAGLLMWLPPGLLYLGVAFVLFWRLLERLEPSVSSRALAGTHMVGGSDEA